MGMIQSAGNFVCHYRGTYAALGALGAAMGTLKVIKDFDGTDSQYYIARCLVGSFDSKALTGFTIVVVGGASGAIVGLTAATALNIFRSCVFGRG